MSRLDDHVNTVRNRMALLEFTQALAWLSVWFVVVALAGVLLDRLFTLSLPRAELWFYGGLAGMVIAALIWALRRRPSPRDAAVPIDQKLGLKEKISTALFIRRSDDPFEKAAVLDAEEAARGVTLNLNQHFPLRFPKPAYATLSLAVVALLSTQLKPLDLFGIKEKKVEQEKQMVEAQTARKNVEKAMAMVNSVSPSVADAEAIKLAKAELQAMLEKPIGDPSKANRTAVKAMQDVGEALKDQIKNNAKYAEAQNEAKMLRSMQKPQEGQGPVSDAHREIAEGKFSEAIEELEKAVENFDKMDKADQQKAAQQMQQLAQQLQQMAQNNQQAQQKMQQQMQNMGMNQQQAQQAQQLMQQAAQGDKQAQQQLQQMAQQVQQQMNQGNGPNPQQQQQMQQMMQQMQAQANAQQAAQQMQQAAQQMAQAMQQGAQQPRQGQGQQQQQAQQGQQPQGMQQAQAQMKQQLQQMQAAAQDAQQIAAAQGAAAAAQAQAQQAMNGANAGNQVAGGQNANAQAGQQGAQPGQWQGQVQPAGPNNGGQGAGDRTYKDQAPYTIKQEISQSQDDENGKILASNFVKDYNPNKGKSAESLKQVTERVFNEQTEEIDQERISRQAQNAVKQYFNSMTKDQP